MNLNNSIIHDLEQRFLGHQPVQELADPVRLFFHIEQAWWFYEDHLRESDSKLPHFAKFEWFAKQMYTKGDLPKKYIPKTFDVAWNAFKDYQHRIPVYGAALLNPDMTKVLLVSSFHATGSWGFPKGKINQDEPELKCALREVWEEVGYDASVLHPSPKDRLDYESKDGKNIHIFIITGAPEDYKYEPKVVKEIGGIRWFPIVELEHGTKKGTTVSSKTFWGVAPFVVPLVKWIKSKKGGSGGPHLQASPPPSPPLGSTFLPDDGDDDRGQAVLMGEKSTRSSHNFGRPAGTIIKQDDGFHIDFSRTSAAMRKYLTLI